MTVNGIGERAGNADLAQTVMVCESILGISTGVETKRLVETSRLVSRYSGIAISPVQPVVGENAFSHESGIHSHGVIANAATFEPGIMTPEMVGHRRRLTLGKHVGRHAVRQMLADVQLAPTDAESTGSSRRSRPSRTAASTSPTPTSTRSPRPSWGSRTAGSGSTSATSRS